MYACMYRFGGASTCAYTRTQAHGATPELQRVADTTSHGLSAGRHSTQTTIGSPSLCGRPHRRIPMCGYSSATPRRAAAVAPQPEDTSNLRVRVVIETKMYM